jgi:WD40 repeat protein
MPSDPPKPLFTLKGHDDPVYAAVFDPQNKLIATASFDKTVRLWDATSGKDLQKPLAGKNGHQGQVLCLAFAPDGNLLASGGADNTVKVWDLNPAKPPPEPTPVKNFAHPNLVSSVAFNKDGTLLASGCNDGFLRVWDMKTGQPTKQIKAHVSQANGKDNQPDPVYAEAWSPDQKHLVTASYDRTVKVWDAASGNMVREIKGGKDVIVPDPKAPVEPGHRDQVFCLAFDPAGKFLATGSSDRTVKLWDFAAGTLVRDFPNPAYKPSGPGQQHPSHPGFVHAVRFTADGAKLVTAGAAPAYKGYLAVWNVADGKLLYGSETAHGPVYSVDLSKDGARLVLGCGQRARSVTESDALVVAMPK